MTTFRATFETTNVDRLLRKLSRSDQFAAASRSLSRAQTTMRKVATEEVQSVLNLKTGPIRDVVQTKRVQRRALVADVLIKSKPQPLIGFKGVRANPRRGVSVQIKRGGPRRIIRSAFKATMRSGHVGIYRRRELGAGRYAGRLPIDELKSSSVRQVLDDRRAQRRILDAGADRFRREFRREIAYRLNRAAV